MSIDFDLHWFDPADMGGEGVGCVACDEVAEMKRYGWDDYFCRKHDEPIYTKYPASKHVR